jgi:hypothetical protein
MKPNTDSPPSGPSTASRWRRRVWGGVLFAGGVALLMFQQPNWMVGTLGGPALAMFGLSGVVYPLAIPDPRPELGVLQGWADVSRKEARVGFIAMGLGFLIGMVLLLF